MLWKDIVVALQSRQSLTTHAFPAWICCNWSMAEMLHLKHWHSSCRGLSVSFLIAFGVQAIIHLETQLAWYWVSKCIPPMQKCRSLYSRYHLAFAVTMAANPKIKCKLLSEDIQINSHAPHLSLSPQPKYEGSSRGMWLRWSHMLTWSWYK